MRVLHWGRANAARCGGGCTYWALLMAGRRGFTQAAHLPLPLLMFAVKDKNTGVNDVAAVKTALWCWSVLLLAEWTEKEHSQEVSSGGGQVGPFFWGQ